MSRFAKTAAVVAGAGALMAGGAGMATADAGAEGVAANSPGVVSGNLVQVPVNIPVNLCGNTVNVIGLLNPAFGNTCVNDGDDEHHGGYGN
ncbi:chaplin [Streptomyces sp. NPDC091272]|uniref:chaplin n=1 Tax=Streptomyces sp. NPDC091272 TaxID=3365981 RepID=UPI00380BA8E5